MTIGMDQQSASFINADNGRKDDKSNGGLSPRRMVLSIVQVGLIFFFISGAFVSLQSIEGSLNYEDGMGTLSLSVLYAVNFLASVFISPSMVHALTPKWTMFLCFFADTFFILSHFWPSWVLLMTSSFILGVFYSPAWVAEGTFTTVLATNYAAKTGQELQSVLSYFNGIFYTFKSLSGIPGNVASSMILRTSSNPRNCYSISDSTDNLNLGENKTYYLNFNVNNISADSACLPKDLSMCGPNHCPYIKAHEVNFWYPEQHVIYALLGTLLALNVTGVFLVLCLPNGIKTGTRFSASKIYSTFSILKRREMQLFVVPCFVTFVNDTIFWGTFLPSFVGCAYGIDKIGFIALFRAGGFFVITASYSLFSNTLAKYRQLIVTSTMVLNLAEMLTWLTWHPQEDTFWVVPVIATMHGLIQGVYKINMGAMTSLLFTDNPEAAFAIYNLVYTTAASFTFGVSFYLCLTSKMYIYFCLLVVMAICYTTLEIQLRKKRTTSYPIVQEVNTSF